MDMWAFSAKPGRRPAYAKANALWHAAALGLGAYRLGGLLMSPAGFTSAALNKYPPYLATKNPFGRSQASFHGLVSIACVKVALQVPVASSDPDASSVAGSC